jgi:hypothetical protein
MRLNKILSIAAVIGLVLTFAAPAPAQGSFGFGYSRYGRHSGFGIGFGTSFYPHHDYYRGYYAYPGYYPYGSYYSGPVVVDQSWVPGYWTTRDEQVWIAGPQRREWVEPQYEMRRDPSGAETRVMIRDGYWRVVQDPGHYETRTAQVWIPGHYL